jgi:NTP pyrophosphatase (non-canonical NTP hydrolase)
MSKENVQWWASKQIEGHGRDRYPSAKRQLIKLIEEVGELAKELNRDIINDNKLKQEMADVQLALAELANKLDIDLSAVVKSKVENDLRKF